MLSALTVFLFITGVFVQPVRPEDRFNYRSTEGRNFGPADWGKVQCDNIANCVSPVEIPYRHGCWYCSHTMSFTSVSAAWLAHKLGCARGIHSV